MADYTVPELERAKRLIRRLSERTQERSFTEAESMEAAVKMDALLKQFDLELSDVFIRESTCETREVYAADMYVGGMIQGIARFCSLVYYHKGGSKPPAYVLYGFKHDLEIALFLYETLMDTEATEWGPYSKIHGFARKKREAFRAGFADRVYGRLVKMRKQRDQEAAERAAKSSSTDLVLMKDHKVQEEFEQTGIRLVKGKARRIHCSTSYYSGAEAGARAQISTALNAEDRAQLGG
jgi:hypothetical protein